MKLISLIMLLVIPALNLVHTPTNLNRIPRGATAKLAIQQFAPYIYLAKDDNLHRGRMNGADYMGPTEAITTGGWTGDIEFYNGYIYMARNGNLERGKMNGADYAGPMEIIATGGWTGDIEFHSGHIYMARRGNLERGKMNGIDYQGPTVPITTGGWTGDIEFYNGYIYMARGGNLERGRMSGAEYVGPMSVITTGGWRGDIEFNNGYIYMARRRNLERGRMNGIEYEGPTAPITTGGWDGDIEFITIPAPAHPLNTSPPTRPSSGGRSGNNPPRPDPDYSGPRTREVFRVTFVGVWNNGIDLEIRVGSHYDPSLNGLYRRFSRRLRRGERMVVPVDKSLSIYYRRPLDPDRPNGQWTEWRNAGPAWDHEVTP